MAQPLIALLIYLSSLGFLDALLVLRGFPSPPLSFPVASYRFHGCLPQLIANLHLVPGCHLHLHLLSALPCPQETSPGSLAEPSRDVP